MLNDMLLRNKNAILRKHFANAAKIGKLLDPQDVLNEPKGKKAAPLGEFADITLLNTCSWLIPDRNVD